MPNDTQPPLIADRLNVSIRKTPILTDVSCEFRRGEVTGILGPNGAGKSTLLRALAGVIQPVSGEIRLEGVSLRRYSRRELALKMGVIPQHTEFSLELSVREVIRMGRFAHRPIYAKMTPDDHQAVENTLIDMRLTDIAERPAHTLSGVERQRMFLAQLLAQEPSVVLLDEPTAHLDVKYQGELMRLVRQLVESKGWTVVVVVHDLNLAYRFCDRLLFLRDGKRLAFGTVEEMARPNVIQDTFDVSAAFQTDQGHPRVAIEL
ncbi:MAG: ABC transporter ATP-binding protein [Candidatus Poribacteria bacterium]|nr:ABC transporter ATP-binding protein [Candidatus Poribacteria bacterium]